MSRLIFPAFFILTIIAGIGLSYSRNASPIQSQINMPDNIKAVIDKSCYGCHSTESTDRKAKEALNFNTMNELSRVRKITKLRGIAESVNKGEMPPKKFIEQYPDRKLTPEEEKALLKWTKGEIDAIIKN